MSSRQAAEPPMLKLLKQGLSWTFFRDSTPNNKEAVPTSTDHCLVLAGAGSGKNLVSLPIESLILFVITESSSSRAAVTFTNKAAGEMRGTR